MFNLKYIEQESLKFRDVLKAGLFGRGNMIMYNLYTFGVFQADYEYIQ